MWDPNPEPQVTGYVLYMGTQSGSLTQRYDMGNVTSYTVSNAVAGQLYCFAVSAYFVPTAEGPRSTQVCGYSNQFPTLANPGNQSSGTGQQVSLQLVGNDPDGLPVTYSATGLPAGVTLGANTGFIGGAATTVGTFSVTARVSDGVLLSAPQTFTWTVTTSPTVDTTPPSVTITGPTSNSSYSALSSTLTVSGTASDNVGVTAVTWTNDRGGSGTATGTTSWSVSSIALQTGTNIITIRARDAAGNQGTDVVTVTRSTTEGGDSIAPTVTITTPTTASTLTTSSSSVTVGGTASDNVGVTQVTWANDRGGSGTASGTTSWSVSSIALQTGTNIITIRARDAAGNQGTDVVTVTRSTTEGGDSIAPTVTITTPTTASTLTTSLSSVTVGGTASDNVGVTQVTWANDRGGSGTASGTTSWSVSGIALQSGTNILTVRARDAAGNQGTDVLTVTYNALEVDLTPPTIAIMGPTQGSSYSTTSSVVTLGGSASDNRGVTAVTWANDRGGSGFSSGTTSWSVPSVALQTGTNVITVSAQDAANNRGTDVLMVTYTPPSVDTTPPSVSIATPTVQPGYAVTVSSVNLGGSSSDNVGVTQVSWANNRGGSGVASGTTIWSVSAVPLQTGDNVITVTARDAAGNQSSDVLTVSFSAPAPTPSTSIVLSATATYGGGGRLKVTLRWQAQGRTVAVFRNTRFVARTSSESYIDKPWGRGPFSYKVCLPESTVCSNTVIVTR
jgi:predicted xylose isomerase-like sugar epimerase